MLDTQRKDMMVLEQQQPRNDQAEQNDGEPTLAVNGLSFDYARTRVWSDISFTLNRGMAAFLVGGNGSGKTTLFNCLAGWIQPSEGSIELCGSRLDGRNREQRSLLFYAPDTPSFYDDLTAREHIRFLLAAQRVDYDASGAEDILKRLDLFDHADRFPSSYSRGMRQKLALAIGLALQPRLLLLDEPFGPLDPDSLETSCVLLDELRQKGTAILLSSHHAIPSLKPDLLLRLDKGHLEPLDEQDPQWTA